MKLQRSTLLGLIVAGLALAACGDDDKPAPTTAPTSAAASPAASAAASAAPATQAPTAARLSPFAAALNGLNCSGTWTNTTFGSTGPFAMTAVATATSGSLTLNIGGSAFGAQGGVMVVPFTLKDGQFAIDADLGFLGKAKMTMGADGKLSGDLTGPPALGVKAKVTVKDFGFADKKVSSTVDIDFGDGRLHATSKLDSTCK